MHVCIKYDCVHKSEPEEDWTRKLDAMFVSVQGFIHACSCLACTNKECRQTDRIQPFPGEAWKRHETCLNMYGLYTFTTLQVRLFHIDLDGTYKEWKPVYVHRTEGKNMDWARLHYRDKTPIQTI